MSVYQRSERWMVYYHDDLGKRHDKSFGRGELGKTKAEAFDVSDRPNESTGCSANGATECSHNGAI